MNEAITQTIINIEQGAKTALIDANYSSNLAYKPQFISNDYKAGRKVLSSIEDELSNCESFMISVAFITMSGITPLLQTLKEYGYAGSITLNLVIEETGEVFETKEGDSNNGIFVRLWL